MARSCEGCGSRIAPFFPRTKVDGEMLCTTCVNNRATARKAATLHYMRYQSSHKVAHDSGDGETLYHCPFCGAGQLIGRSDGTAECEFCGTAFTVQVQPSLSTQPQTIDGEPVMMPDMPGVPGGEPGVPEEEILADSEETALAPDEGEDDMDDKGKDPSANPFQPNQPAKPSNPFSSALKQPVSYKTAAGASLSEDDYIRHLAIRHASDRGRVIAEVRASRRR